MMQVNVKPHSGYWVATWEDELGKYLATSTQSREHAIFSLGVIIGGRREFGPRLRTITSQTQVRREDE